MDIEVFDNPIYKNQTFRLKFKFSAGYPIGASPPSSISLPQCTNFLLIHISTEAPEVTFHLTSYPPRPIPLHPHVYSNGYICLDLLGREGWSPVQNVQSICVSLQSMLASNTDPSRPEGDELFVRTNRRRPRDVQYMYDDDKV